MVVMVMLKSSSLVSFARTQLEMKLQFYYTQNVRENTMKITFTIIGNVYLVCVSIQ